MTCAWCGKTIDTEHLEHDSGELVHFECDSEYCNSRGLELSKLEEKE